MKQVQEYRTTKQKREASFELLRIIAMCMIISLHYLSKGDLLRPLSEAEGMNGAAAAAWVMEALCLVAVNVYVLISGYFGLHSSFRLSKLLRLWGTVIFYSVCITLLLGLTGNLSQAGNVISLAQFSIYDWMNVIFPVVTQQYWFITAYVVLYLCMPFLNAGMEKLDRRTFRNILICLFVIFSVSKSVLPMELPTDQKGYDVLWLICVYLLGGYFGRYGCPVFDKTRRSVLLYLAGAAATAGAAFAVRYLYLTRGMLAEFVLKNRFYTYNHIFCLAASIGFFGIFTKVHIKSVKLSKLICEAASCTMAVYLIHEQLYLRYLWPEWFQVHSQAGKWTFLPHMIVTVAAVFVICASVEWIRKTLAGKIGQKVVSLDE